MHIFTFHTIEKPITISACLSDVSLSISLQTVFCALFTGKRLRWNFFICSIRAWNEYRILEIVKYLFGNKTAAAQNLLSSGFGRDFVHLSVIKPVIVYVELPYVLWKWNGSLIKPYIYFSFGRNFVLLLSVKREHWTLLLCSIQEWEGL